ncbi:MAG: hypothetical protein J7621_19420 [Niastella sp.]|nr:hypothetical protein [Niastella sp.]
MSAQRYQILAGLPSYGPMYVPVSPDGIPFYSEGFVVQFFNSDGTSWIGNFQRGLETFNHVYDFPELGKTVVFAYGQCYIMTDGEQKPLKTLGYGISQVFQASDNTLIAADQTDVIVIEIGNDIVWYSERISWDGFADLAFSGDTLSGLAYKPTSSADEWEPFSFNYRTKELIGGTYPTAATKPWWKFW